MNVVLKRPLIDMDTRLRDIPIDWLRYVEPKIMRGPYLPCWIWTATLDSKGYPMMLDPYIKGKQVMVRRWVAGLFYDFDRSLYVPLRCTRRNCVNPNHMYISETHPRWINREQ